MWRLFSDTLQSVTPRRAPIRRGLCRQRRQFGAALRLHRAPRIRPPRHAFAGGHAPRGRYTPRCAGANRRISAPSPRPDMPHTPGLQTRSTPASALNPTRVRRPIAFAKGLARPCGRIRFSTAPPCHDSVTRHRYAIAGTIIERIGPYAGLHRPAAHIGALEPRTGAPDTRSGATDSQFLSSTSMTASRPIRRHRAAHAAAAGCSDPVPGLSEHPARGISAGCHGPLSLSRLLAGFQAFGSRP